MSDHSEPDSHGFVVWDETREEVVGVDEGQIALALLKGQKELLSEMVQSQWGPVRLFDLCLRCDHLGMALALAAHGVPGCILEDHHVGPISADYSERRCSCQGWNTCHYCCWAFPVEQGIFMQDWDEALVYAIPAAREAAATPLTHAMLDLCSSDMELPFSGSPKAMARLLDIAMLTGNQKAAINLSKKCELQPLRRWVMEWTSEDCWKAARTALWAGADFQDLMVDRSFSEDVPFRQALFLNSKLEDWQEIRHLLPQSQDLWRPRSLDNRFGIRFVEQPRWKLSLDKICAAEDAGLDLQFLFVGVGAARFVTLLDMAIFCGQPDCAKACVDGGIELKGDDRPLAWHKQVLLGESPGEDWDGPALNIVPSETQIAAAAAGRAWLRRCWKSEASQKGIVLYQLMVKMLKGKSFSMGLVQEILTYSMPVPKIIDQLDLWEHVGGWMATIWGRPASVHAATDCNTADIEEPERLQDNDEAGLEPGVQSLNM